MEIETVETNDLELALERAAQAEERAARLALELDAAHRKIADLQDHDYLGNTDPVLERMAIAKSRVGKTAIGSRLAPLYRRLFRR